jgi:polyisoprenoid-binding protein YceI
MSETATHDPLSRELLGPWALDIGQTQVHLAHKTMWGLVTVKGTVDAVEGAGQLEPDGSLTGTMKLSASSIDTGNPKRDVHLRSADFFDVDRYPTLDLRILSGTVVDGQIQLQGELTVKGISEPQALVARITGSTPTSVTVVVDTEVDRDRFGISWDKGGMIKGMTEVHVDAQFTRVG